MKTIPDERTLKDHIMPILTNLIIYLRNLDSGTNELLCTMFSRLSDKIIKLCNDDFNKKQKYLEILCKDKLTTELCEVLKRNVQNFTSTKLTLIESIIRGLNRLCYHSSALYFEAVNADIIHILENIISIIENNPSKGNFNLYMSY